MRAVYPNKPIRSLKSRSPIRRIAILAAMASQLGYVERSLGMDCSENEGEGYRTGTYKGITVITAVTTVNSASAQSATENLFARYGTAIDHVFIVGTASAFDLRLKVGELFIPESIVDRRDGIARRPVNLSARESSGMLYSADQRDYDNDYVATLNNNNVTGIDGGSGAVVAVCERYRCPVTIVKAISDRVDLLAEPRDVFCLAGSSKYRSAVRFVLARPQRIAYLIVIILSEKKAMAAAAAELFKNIERLLQQDRHIEKDGNVDGVKAVLQTSRILAQASERR